MHTVLLIVGIIFFVLFWLLFIFGVINACKTQDTEVRAGRVFLHFFLFGGILAAIIYAIIACRNSLNNEQQINHK